MSVHSYGHHGLAIRTLATSRSSRLEGHLDQRVNRTSKRLKFQHTQGKTMGEEWLIETDRRETSKPSSIIARLDFDNCRLLNEIEKALFSVGQKRILIVAEDFTIHVNTSFQKPSGHETINRPNARFIANSNAPVGIRGSQSPERLCSSEQNPTAAPTHKKQTNEPWAGLLKLVAESSRSEWMN